MPTRYSESDHIGDEAVNFIRSICTYSKQALFWEEPGKDIGIDAHLDLLNENGEPTGAIALIQSKGGLSYVKTGKYLIKADKKHFETWSKYSNPVIGIVYNPLLRDARWVSISDHLQSHPDCIHKGPYLIEAPLNQPFSLEGFNKFHNYVTEQHAKRGSNTSEMLIEQYLSGDNITKIECLVQIFSFYRWTPLACFFSHQVLRVEEDTDILKQLTYLISFYRPYGDRFYNENNTIPKHMDFLLRGLAQKCIDSFGKTEVLKMLSTIDDDNALERGSFGQLVTTQLSYISDIKGILCNLAKDRLLEAQTRGYSILILSAFLNYTDLTFYKSLLQSENDSFVIETLDWALENIEEE